MLRFLLVEAAQVTVRSVPKQDTLYFQRIGSGKRTELP